MDWEKSVCVCQLTHRILIAASFFQHAEPVVTVCQFLNFIRYCLCLASLNSLSFPSRLSCSHLNAFVYLSLLPPVSVKLPLLSSFTHNFTYFVSLSVITRLQYSACVSAVPCLGKPTMMQGEQQCVWSLAHTLLVEAQDGLALHCVIMSECTGPLKLRMLDVSYKGRTVLNHEI